MIELKVKDKFQIQYLLPVTGSIDTLETVQGILDELNIIPEDEISDKICKINLKDNEIQFLKQMINFLSQSQKLHLKSLQVVKQILNIKETNNV